MNETPTITTTLSRSEFETLVRKTMHREMEPLLRQIVREELADLLKSRSGRGSGEEPDGPAGDEELLNEVLTQIEQEKASPNPRIPWEAAKAELARAEERIDYESL
jgi:hypothetical protein